MPALLPPLLGLTLVRNGNYPRLLPVATGFAKGKICRKKCPGCRTNFSLLPNDVVPLHTYGLHLICSRLRASLEGQFDGSKAFYEEHGLIPDDPTVRDAELVLKATSWSDRVSELCPSPQLFRHWRRKWPLRAQAWLHRLLLACIYSGCDLKARLGDSLQGFVDCPESMRALPLAAGLVGLLQEKPAWVSFSTTVFLLGCASSHKIFRAAGRPPPHYGGDLELLQHQAF